MDRTLPAHLDQVTARKVGQFQRTSVSRGAIASDLPRNTGKCEHMCGIAGVVDLARRHPVESGVIRAMAGALFHRGPDEDGFLERDGLALASRRLSIVGLADGQQPISNEDRSVWVVFNGELFDYPERRAELEAKGHFFRTHTDTELLPHLWEEYGEEMFAQLSGQFAFALWDSRAQTLILARDRMGICPLLWTVQRTGDGREVLLFASEIKALLASGMVSAKPDLFGLNHVFSFFAVPGPRTCFEGIQTLLPGRFLKIKLDGTQSLPLGQGRIYWQPEFPDWGSERRCSGDAERVVDEFESVLLNAVEQRLRADVPVVSYLSGGVDSSMVVALAGKVLGRSIPTFTISVKADGLDEESEAAAVARHLGCESIVVNYGHTEVCDTYPDLISAAEAPVIDTSCAALLMLARGVQAQGYKVALTGEGADEWLAGYSWFKLHRALSFLDVVPGLPVSQWLRRLMLRVSGQPRFPMEHVRRAQRAVGGHNAWLDVYGVMATSKLRFLAPEVRDRILSRVPYEDLELNPNLHRWHPFHRALYVGGRIMLAGHLLCSKGDRVAMHSSIETRYPFLDEKVWGFLAGLHPHWKLRGFHDKYILRRLARRWLPKSVATRRKAMFRAPMDSFHLRPEQSCSVSPWVDQVLSPESLRKTGYFDVDAVTKWRAAVPTMRRSLRRTSTEMGLMAVTATQLWHHLFIRGDLAEIPGAPREQPVLHRPRQAEKHPRLNCV